VSCPGHYCARCDDARYDGWIGCKRCEDRLRAALAKAEAERDEARDCAEDERARAERYLEAIKAFVCAWHKHPVTVWAEPVSLAADALWNLADEGEREWLK
jgi:hypothetical protein